MTLTARSPEDLLAMVPVVLGFTPAHSLVMLTFGAPKPFHARVDLPDRPREVRAVTAALLEPVARHRVERVVLVGYCPDVDRADRVTEEVGAAFERAGIEVIARLASAGTHWWLLPRGLDEPGTAYDASTHPFAAQAVWNGMVTHESRDDLAATMAADPAAIAETERALAGHRLPAAPDDAWVAEEASWAVGLVTHSVAVGASPRPTALARLAEGMRDLTVRDAVWFTLSRADAQRQVAFWTDVVRRCPASHLAGPAAVLGFAAWISGQGALAWCAADRAREGDPDYLLAELLGAVLTGAMPPETWDRIVDDHQAS